MTSATRKQVADAFGLNQKPGGMKHTERNFLIENLLVRVHFTIVMIIWTGLVLWDFEFPFPGSLTSSLQYKAYTWKQVAVAFGRYRPHSVGIRIIFS